MAGVAQPHYIPAVKFNRGLTPESSRVVEKLPELNRPATPDRTIAMEKRGDRPSLSVVDVGERRIDPPTAAYLHIPFCRRRCYYCDFPISVVGDTRRGENSGAIAAYVAQLCREIAITPSLGPALQTIFFGGGTPSLLSVAQLEQILAALNRQFGIAAGAELSMEMDPGTFDQAHSQGYRAAGINRVSLGVQAFQTELLHACGRTHTRDDVYAAMALLQQSQMPSISLDLISGLPGQTLAQWQASLEEAIALMPTHISVYDLTIETGTAFGRRYTPGESPLPSDEMTVAMYRLAQQRLTAAGFEHYEISNYARPGFQCRHNRVYWENRAYYGFGMGAASYTQERRFTRPRTRREYGAWLEAGATIDAPVTPPTERLLDTLMVGLRLAEGLSLDQLRQRFGEPVVEAIALCLEPYHHQGLVQEQGDRLRLTDPDGFLLSNTILATLFHRFGADVDETDRD